MLKFIVNLESNSNDAFIDNERAEVARILRDAAERIESGNSHGFALYDINGNKCGEVLQGQE